MVFSNFETFYLAKGDSYLSKFINISGTLLGTSSDRKCLALFGYMHTK